MHGQFALHGVDPLISIDPLPRGLDRTDHHHGKYYSFEDVRITPKPVQRPIPTWARQIRYYRECAIPAFPGDPKNAPPSYRYFVDMVERLKNVKPEDLTENSVLLGSSARIVEILKKVDAAGFDEVILYVNVGLKPHQQVKDEMARFMAEVAPAFASVRKEAAA
jgi:hypothetical protein